MTDSDPTETGTDPDWDDYKVDDRAPQKLNHWYTAAWVFWIAFFLFVEGKAIKDKAKGDTLSEHVWYAQEKFKSWGFVGKILYGLLAVGILVLLVWLIPHFLLGWW